MPDETPRGPIIAPAGASPAEASRPDQPLDERYHIYESNPAPWWVGVLWLIYLISGATYLIVNLMR